MKIFIEDNAWGHVVTRRMIPVWESMGHTLRRKAKGCHVQLSFIRIREKKTKLPKVVRFDGVYYDLDTEYRDRNATISAAHGRADAIIYQSRTAEAMCRRYLENPKACALSAVIYNGIEPDWCGRHIAEHKGLFNVVVSAKWRRHKRLKETIDVFLRCLPSMPEARLHIFGMLHDNKRVRHPAIKYYGMVNRKSIMRGILMRSDLSIHLSKRDCCPNSVVEAIGAGIPVITTSACGGAAEMCAMTPGCVVCEGDKDSHKPCYPYRDAYNMLSKGLSRNLVNAILQVYGDRRRVILPRELNIEHMAEEYARVMREVSG